MDEWIGTQRELYVQAIIGWDSPHGVNQCGLRLKTPALWRCTDCLGNHALWQDCCQKDHKNLPFHWIEFWTGSHYKRDWLSNLEVVIHLGHHGSPCPLWEPITLVGELRPHIEDWNIYNSPSGLADTPQDCTLRNVARNNRIHKVWIQKCLCMDGCEEYQYLELGLYLISYTQIKTLFTFDLLQNCCLDNLECKASVYHLWSKLRRLTCSFFPNGVPASNVLFIWKMCISNQRSDFHRIGIRNCFAFSDNGEI